MVARVDESGRIEARVFACRDAVAVARGRGAVGSTIIDPRPRVGALNLGRGGSWSKPGQLHWLCRLGASCELLTLAAR